MCGRLINMATPYIFTCNLLLSCCLMFSVQAYPQLDALSETWKSTASLREGASNINGGESIFDTDDNVKVNGNAEYIGSNAGVIEDSVGRVAAKRNYYGLQQNYNRPANNEKPRNINQFAAVQKNYNMRRVEEDYGRITFPNAYEESANQKNDGVYSNQENVNTSQRKQIPDSRIENEKLAQVFKIDENWGKPVLGEDYSRTTEQTQESTNQATTTKEKTLENPENTPKSFDDRFLFLTKPCPNGEREDYRNMCRKSS